MRIYKEMSSVRDFMFWSGAADNFKYVVEAGKVEALDFVIEEIFPAGCSDTELNDLLWFEFDQICEWIGMDNPYDCPLLDSIKELKVS